MAEGRELELLISHLKDVPISQEPDKYTQLFSNLYNHPLKKEIITGIFSNIDNTTVFLSTIPAYFKPETVETDSSTVLSIISKSRDLCGEVSGNFDLLCKVLFKSLEGKKVQIEVKSAVFKIFEEIEFSTESIMSNALSMLQYEHTTSILTEIILYISALRKINVQSDKEEISAGMSDSNAKEENLLGEILEYLLQESEHSKDTVIQKNYSSLILKICESIRQQGISDIINPLLQSITSEVQCIRNSASESAVSISKALKTQIEQERKGEKELATIISAVIERTMDVSPFCRGRAIQSLTDILCNNGILENLKERVYTSLHERIMDKTQMVRKKTIIFFKRALESHPYVLDGGMLNLQRLKAHEKTDPAYYASATSFYQAIHTSVEVIKQLLKAGSKGEITEIIQYVSLCYSYGIENALEVFPSLFLFSWQRLTLDGRNAADVLSEEIRKMVDGNPKKLIDLLVHFDSDSLAYEGTIRDLTLRGILGIEAINTLFYQIDKEKDVLMHLRLLRRLSTTDRSVTESALPRIYAVLGKSTDRSIICEAIRILGNLDYRSGNSSETIRAVVNALSLADNNNLEIVQTVIDTAYLISLNPDELAVEVLDILLESENPLPVIFAVGHIAIKQAVHLERVEAAWNNQAKTKTPVSASKKRKESISNMEIRERRLSVGSKRNSLKNTTEEQEEMADRVFFAKEHEILFGETSALKGLLDVVVAGIYSPDETVKKVSLLSLGKIMSISSECSSRFMNDVINILKTGSDHLQIIALVIIADSVMAFSSLVKNAGNSLFLPLKTQSEEVKMTALVLIRNLLRSGMVKVKDNYWALSLLLLDDSDIKATAQKLFEEAAERESPMKILCEVIKSYLIERHTLTASENEISQSKEDDHIDGHSKQSPHHLLVEVVKALTKITTITDMSKKIQEWSLSKNDALVTEVCTAILEEIPKAPNTIQTA
ncbi:hypothetical protein NEIRO03_2223 [Nematocida sp. AWRm78]|nr:hypothetical protein NEIRO03_2223 [Nematocida sp. AWRm78]